MPWREVTASLTYSEANMSEIVRVLRVLEYVGPRKDVEEIIMRSIHGTKVLRTSGLADVKLTAITVHEFAEVVETVPTLPSLRNAPDVGSGG